MGERAVEELSRCDALLWWELKTCLLKGEDLRAGEVGTNLDGLDWKNMRFLLTIRKGHDPFPTRASYANALCRRGRRRSPYA